MIHPLTENRRGFWVWLAAWIFLAVCRFSLFYYALDGDILVLLADSLISIAVFSFFALILWFPMEALNKNRSGYFSHIINIVVLGAVTIGLWIVVIRLILPLIYTDFQYLWEATLAYRIGEGILLFSLVVLAYYLIITLYSLSEKKAREAELETLVRDTELKMLRSQINPHFLFNSLTSVGSLTVTNPEKSREMIIKLSDFMRYALSRKNDQLVPLSAELESARLYMDIEKVRFGDKMVTEEDIDNRALGVKLPVMLLQPLYENAVKHGVYESTGKVGIKTKVSYNTYQVEITISNNYDIDAMPVKGTGTGLLSTARRLELQYGKRASLTTSKKEGLFEAKIIVPSTD
ncbi:MAG: sensor histidine kinase [Bacteroidales bacterium]|jgi:two-component system LytT family sensor kinase